MHSTGGAPRDSFAGFNTHYCSSPCCCSFHLDTITPESYDSYPGSLDPADDAQYLSVIEE